MPNVLNKSIQQIGNLQDNYQISIRASDYDENQRIIVFLEPVSRYRRAEEQSCPCHGCAHYARRDGKKNRADYFGCVVWEKEVLIQI